MTVQLLHCDVDVQVKAYEFYDRRTTENGPYT